ncbi:hypothetical protein McanMca71_003181 [Microsporum canis]
MGQGQSARTGKAGTDDLESRGIEPKTYSIADYDLSTFDLGVAEEPCGQRNFPRTVQQLVELALSTFGQKWPPTAIQIYSRLQELQDPNYLDLFDSDTWKRSYAHHTNRHLKLWTAWGAANLKAAIRPDASKDIPDQTPLKLEYDLDSLTRVHLRERERHMLLVSSGKTLASFHVWDRPSGYSSCPWEDLTWTSYTSTLSPLQPYHVSVLLFFSFQGVPQLSWAINLYSVAAKGSLKAFVQYLMTAADLRPYKLYESSVGEPESTALPERQMLLTQEAWDELRAQGVIYTNTDGQFLSTRPSALRSCYNNTPMAFHTAQDFRTFVPSSTQISLRPTPLLEAAAARKVKELQATAREKGLSRMVTPQEVADITRECEEHFKLTHLSQANYNRHLCGLPPFTLPELEAFLRDPLRWDDSDSDQASVSSVSSAPVVGPRIQPWTPYNHLLEQQEVEDEEPQDEGLGGEDGEEPTSGRRNPRVLDTDGASDTPTPTKARRAAGMHRPTFAKAKIVVQSFDYMDGAPRVATEDWTLFSKDIGTLSASNLPPFFRKLSKGHVQQMHSLASSAQVTKRELGFYWTFNFNKDGVIKNHGSDSSQGGTPAVPWTSNVDVRLVLRHDEELRELQVQLEASQGDLEAARATIADLLEGKAALLQRISELQTSVKVDQVDRATMEQKREDFVAATRREREMRGLRNEVEDLHRELQFEKGLTAELTRRLGLH